jgi:hypothetical protein
VIREYIACTPNCYLDELQEHIALRLQRNVDATTVYRLVRAMGYTSKRISRIFARQSNEERLEFFQRMQQTGYETHQLVFMDESSLQNKHWQRNMVLALQ